MSEPTQATENVARKACPQCGTETYRASKKCPNCGHRFKGKKKPKTLEAREPELPEFAVGPAMGGGAVLVWPRRGEQVALTPAEWAMVRSVADLPRGTE